MKMFKQNDTTVKFRNSDKMSMKTKEKQKKNIKMSKMSKMKSQARKSVMKLSNVKHYNKTKKCQPAARDTTDLIQTAGVPDRGLARPKIKITE